MNRLIAITVLLLVSAPLVADVIENDSLRYTIAASQGGNVMDGPTGDDAIPIYGPFMSYVETFAFDPIHGGSSQTSQSSNVSPHTYEVDLYARTDAGGSSMGMAIATGHAESYYEVRFTLTEPTDYHINGSYNAFGAINGAVSLSDIRIDGISPGAPSIVIATTVDDCCPSVNHDGTLPAGSYALRAIALAMVDHSFMTSYNEGNAETRFTMTFDVPLADIAGDMNCDGQLNTNDVAPFVQALVDAGSYSATYPACDIQRGDFNSDSLVDGDDVRLFVDALLMP